MRIQISSDGTPRGTRVGVHGAPDGGSGDLKAITGIDVSLRPEGCGAQIQLDEFSLNIETIECEMFVNIDGKRYLLVDVDEYDVVKDEDGITLQRRS